VTCAALARIDGARCRPAARPWRWLSVAAAVITVVGGAWLVATLPRNAAELTAREAVSGHVRSLMANHLTDVASTDQHTVKPWFAGKLDFSPPVSDFAARAIHSLAGASITWRATRSRRSSTAQQAHVNVFVWPEPRHGRGSHPP